MNLPFDRVMKRHRLIAGLAGFGLLLCGLPATAKEPTPEISPFLAAIETIDVAMKKQEWAKAESDLISIIKNLGHPSYPRETILSELFFKKGWCEFNQKKWKEAGKSFETCYKDFPDKPKKEPSAESLRFRRESLRYWADALYNLEDYEGAAKLYRHYIKELRHTK
jgi:TolA-binding protein